MALLLADVLGMTVLWRSDEVTRADVDEAMRLIHMSKGAGVLSLVARRLLLLTPLPPPAASLEIERGRSAVIDPVSAIYAIVRDAMGERGSARITDVLPLVLSKGYRQQQLEECIAEYEDLNVWQKSADGLRIIAV